MRARLLAVAACALMTAEAKASIYTCIDSSGKSVTSDRPITRCVGEQRELRPDGSTLRVVPPPQTEDEKAEEESRRRKEETERAARRAEIRTNANLLNRFPDKAAHDRAREEAQRPIARAADIATVQLADLRQKRKKLMDEAEFYQGKALPAKLKSDIDANDALLAAQLQLIQGQQEEMQRIDQLFDAELARLQKLWQARK